jgi:NitT/TauT family transport system ATP-binding protein
VMSPGPGRIDSQMQIALPRPRDVVAADFNDIRRELSLRLHSHHARKAA